MGRPPDHDIGTDDLAGDGQWQVVLTEVQDGGAGGAGDVGPIVDCEQLAVALGGLGEHLEQAQLVGGLETLFTQLDDVDSGIENGVQKIGEITLPRTGIRAQVQAGGGELSAGVEHWASLVSAARVGFDRHGSPASVGLRGRKPTVEPDPGNAGAREHMSNSPAGRRTVVGNDVAAGTVAASSTASDLAVSDVVVIGGGVIGLGIAWRCAQHGLSVTVVDPAPACGASHTAAGMLAPVTELTYGEDALLHLGIESARRYPAFVAELTAATSIDVGYRASGAVVAAWDSADLATLRDLHAFQLALGLRAELLTSRELRQLEPLLAPGLPGGLYAADDHQVDNRLLHKALLAVGPTVVRHRVAALLRAGDRVNGVRLDDGRELSAGVTVLAAGAWSSQIEGVPSELGVRPVKGQTVRLRAQTQLDHVVRATVKGRPVYAAQRANGEIVVGASTEEAGFDLLPRAGAVYELLRDAQSVLPSLSEAEFVEVSTSVRPGSPDNAPIIGRSELDGLIIASGHYRNGILLTPVTADAVAELIDTGATPDVVRAFSPARFTGARA